LQNGTILHIGIDDTDSPKGMCTTFLSYQIVKFLEKQDIEFVDFPSLIRLILTSHGRHEEMVLFG